VADNVTVTAKTIAPLQLTEIDVSTDEVVGPPVRHVQRMKLAYSADGVETHVQADAEGLLVSANPKVAVASNQGTQVTVDDGAGGDVILATNANRNGFSIIPNGDIYLSFGGTPTSSTFLLSAFQPFSMLSGVIYTGEIKGLAPAGTTVTVYVLEV
jgi:hypothetical protein